MNLKTFLMENNKRYTPDFYLIDLDIWIEVKPCYFLDEEALYKFKQVRGQGNKIYFLTEKNWDKLITIITTS